MPLFSTPPGSRKGQNGGMGWARGVGAEGERGPGNKGEAGIYPYNVRSYQLKLDVFLVCAHVTHAWSLKQGLFPQHGSYHAQIRDRSVLNVGTCPSEETRHSLVQAATIV